MLSMCTFSAPPATAPSTKMGPVAGFTASQSRSSILSCGPVSWLLKQSFVRMRTVSPDGTVSTGSRSRSKKNSVLSSFSSIIRFPIRSFSPSPSGMASATSHAVAAFLLLCAIVKSQVSKQFAKLARRNSVNLAQQCKFRVRSIAHPPARAPTRQAHKFPPSEPPPHRSFGHPGRKPLRFAIRRLRHNTRDRAEDSWQTA